MTTSIGWAGRDLSTPDDGRRVVWMKPTMFPLSKESP
jgi:hypothetical protein